MFFEAASPEGNHDVVPYFPTELISVCPKNWTRKLLILCTANVVFVVRCLALWNTGFSVIRK